RGRVLRQQLTESLLLAVIGGSAGLALAWWSLIGLRSIAPASLPHPETISIDGVVAVFNFAIACVTGLACGLAPAWQAGRTDLHEAIKAESRAASHRAGTRARNLLVVAETALGVVVLVGSGLLLRSFWELQHVAVGFESDQLLTFRVVVPRARYG